MTGKMHIGNGVFVEIGERPGDIMLTTWDGYKTTNAIYFEAEALENFLHFVDMTKINNGSSSESES